MRGKKKSQAHLLPEKKGNRKEADKKKGGRRIREAVIANHCSRKRRRKENFRLASSDCGEARGRRSLEEKIGGIFVFIVCN